MSLKIDHIGIAVQSISQAQSLYQSLGLRMDGTEEVEEQQVKVAFLPVGESKIELLEPLSDDGAIGKFLEKRGQGIHHIALRVTELEATVKKLKAEGVRFIDEVPRRGAGGARIVFLHPKDTFGTLIELCERK